MKRKVFLIAGHHSADPGAVANNVCEADLTIELQSLIAQNLKDLKIDFLTDNPNQKLSEVIRWLSITSNKEDIILDLHFNSGLASSTGCECLYPIRPTDEELRLAEDLSRVTARVLGIRDRGAKSEQASARGRLAIMEPRGTNVLLEVCFITNKNDLDSYVAKRKELAKEIAKELSKYVNNKA